MNPMLTEEDLKAIGTIVEDKIDALEERVNLKFDAVQESLDSIENRIVTKSYLDDKLAHYASKPF